MSSPLVVMMAVEALGAAFLTFLVTKEEAANGLLVVRELFCLVGDMVSNKLEKR